MEAEVLITAVLKELAKHRARRLRKINRNSDDPDFDEGVAQGYYDAKYILKNTYDRLLECEASKKSSAPTPSSTRTVGM